MNNDLMNMCNGIAQELEDIFYGEVEEDGPADMWEYLSDILDYDVTYDSQGVYRGCSIMVTCGGPNIYIDTINSEVRGYWWTDFERVPITRGACDLIDEIMSEITMC